MFGRGEGFGTERDGLIGGRGGFLAGEGFEEGPVFGGVGGVSRGECVLPLLSVVSGDGEGDFVVELSDAGVGRVLLSEVVALSDEGWDVGGEVGGVVFVETGRDGMFGGLEENLAEGALAGGAGGWRGEEGKKSFGLVFKVIPVCSSKIQKSFDFAWRSFVICGHGDENGEVVGAEGGHGVPGEGGGEVGRAEGEVWGGRLSEGGESGGGVLVEETEIAAV